MNDSIDAFERRSRKVAAGMPAIALGAIAAIALVASALSDAGRADEGGGTHVHTVACADTQLVEIPENTEINTVYDAEGGLLEVSFTSPQDGADRQFVIDTRNDSACRSRDDVRHLVDHVEASWEESMRESCTGTKAFARSGQSKLDGLPVNQTALDAHLKKWCS